MTERGESGSARNRRVDARTAARLGIVAAVAGLLWLRGEVDVRATVIAAAAALLAGWPIMRTALGHRRAHRRTALSRERRTSSRNV